MSKRILPLLCLLMSVSVSSFCQRVTFSPVQREEDVNMEFEILGRVDSNFLVYKNLRGKHTLTLYDRNMKPVINERLSFMPEKTVNADFILYPRFFYVIYQFEKNDIVYCYAAKLDNNGKKINEPLLLDTARIGFAGDKRLYSSVFSEDKQKILIYKMRLKGGRLSLGARIFDSDMNLIDSSVLSSAFSDREEFLSDLSIANDGTIYFARNKREGRNDNFHALELCLRPAGGSGFSTVEIPLDGTFIDEVVLKIDNLNRSLIVNSFYYSSNRGNILGLFTAVRKISGDIRYTFNPIEDDIRSSISKSGVSRQAFDNLFIRNTYVRRNGSFVITSEDYSTQRQVDNYAWSRSDYLSNFGYPGMNDFYFPGSFGYYNPGFYRSYRPYTGLQSIRYYYDDVLVMSIDSSLQMKWQKVIPKKQVDDDNENFLSFGTMNYGGELHFFFIEDNRKNDVVTNQSIRPDGEIRRYGSLKSREFAYSFMPRLAKQTGSREMIIPCSNRGNICFALIDFN